MVHCECGNECLGTPTFVDDVQVCHTCWKIYCAVKQRNYGPAKVCSNCYHYGYRIVGSNQCEKHKMPISDFNVCDDWCKDVDDSLEQLFG